MGVDWTALRREFLSLDRCTYLDTATIGQIPRRSSEAVARHFAHRDETACKEFFTWFDDADRLRACLAEMIHAEAADIAFSPNVSTALAALLRGIDWQAGDRIVTFSGEFPNNLYAPSLLAARGVDFVETDWRNFEAAIAPNTRLVLMSTVNYSTGFAPPLEEVASLLHERGVDLYLDGTQSIGALRLDVSRLRPVMLAAHGYKWLISPPGACFYYVRPDIRRRIEPPIIGWRSHREWRSIAQLHHGVPEFPTGAERYEGGMLPFPLLCALEASVGLLFEAGLENIERRVLDLASRARGLLRDLGATVTADELPHHEAPVVTARFHGIESQPLALRLRERGVLVSARHGYLRVSTHFYNDEVDIYRLGSALRETL